MLLSDKLSQTLEEEIVPVYKLPCETPLECIKRFKHSHPAYAKKTISYAGRLDPMADGLLILLVGGANKRRRQYEKLEKEYLVSVLFGISTDSGDLLGMIQNHGVYATPTFNDLHKVCDSFLGVSEQKYPAFSSKYYDGKPLFYHARHNSLPTIMPKHEINIQSITFEGVVESITSEQVLERMHKNVSKVIGNFRQEEILKDWNRKLAAKNEQYCMQRMRVRSSAGAFMRVLAEDVGRKLQIPSLALQITRVTCGEYTLAQAKRF